MADGDTGAHLWTVPVQLKSAADTGRLVFHGYGNVRVLQSMWIGGRAEGVELPKSKTERELARVAGTDMIARAAVKPAVEVISAQ